MAGTSATNSSPVKKPESAANVGGSRCHQFGCEAAGTSVSVASVSLLIGSSLSDGAADDLEAHARALEPRGQGGAHGLRGGDLTGRRRVVVEGQAQGALGEGDAGEVVGVHAADPRV